MEPSEGPMPADAGSDEPERLSQAEADMDSMHILPLNIIPLLTPSLRRARLIKNVRLESVVELFNDSDAGSGQVDLNELPQIFGWPNGPPHPDFRTLSALAELHSFDVYTLRIQLRQLGIDVEHQNALKLSGKKCGELMVYMNQFTLPLLRKIYDTADSDACNMAELIAKYTTPDKREALNNLKHMASKLNVEIKAIPDFIEEYADIYLSVSYGKFCLNGLIPQILMFEESMEELKENMELSSDVRLMRSIDFIKDSITDVTASVVSRFESFDRASESMWEDISAESFESVKKMVRSHHVTIGAILCSLTLKMNGWQHNLSAGRGLVRRADFIRSDMMQGMEKINGIEDLVQKQQQATPTWEAFTVDKSI